MINLIVPEYCQSCTDFEPQVTQRPEQVEAGYGNLILCGDTYVECEYRHRCKTIYEHLEHVVATVNLDQAKYTKEKDKK